MPVRVAELTVRFALPATPPKVAMIWTGVALAWRTVATPSVVMEAMEGADDDHVTTPVRSMLEPSPYRPVAVYDWLPPTGRLAPGAVTTTWIRVAAVTVSWADPVTSTASP